MTSNDSIVNLGLIYNTSAYPPAFTVDRGGVRYGEPKTVRLTDLDGGEALEAIQDAVNRLLRTRREEAEAVCEEEPEDEHAYGELYALKEIQSALDDLFKDLPARIYTKGQQPHPYSGPTFKW